MQIANSIENRIQLEEGKQRRRQLLQIFYKYITEDITIIPTYEYKRILDENRKLSVQLKMLNELRQAEADRRDVHRPV